ncbi:MAG: SusC/RagA family TonB-linked outer membrane protein [Cyclobacteriaceae bacterium]|nr:SusC/RagA family TonB-linked outer membrane protein [Cyclobacteriaceae bacterium SS2]
MKLKLLKKIAIMSRYVIIGILIQSLLYSFALPESGTAQKISIEEIEISIDVNNLTVQETLDKVEAATDFEFAYKRKIIDNGQKLSFGQQRTTIAELLRSISKETNLGFKRVNEVIYVNKSVETAFPVTEEIITADITVNGKITDEANSGLPGASIVIKGLGTGTTTDIDGNFSLSAPEDAVLVISYVGYSTIEVPVQNRTQINIQLEPDSQQLNEIVVTAFGIEKEKKALGYSAQEVSGDELVEAREVNVANSLKGKVAGVFVNSSSGGPGGSSFVQIRGSSSLGGNNQPLYVVDGIPISNDNLAQTNIFAGRDFGDGIKDINPDDIETISVLKGPNAASLYGARGANGVILITTKKSSRKGIGVTFNSNATFETLNVIPKFQTSYGPTYDDAYSFPTTTIDGVDYDMIPGWALDNWGGAYDGRQIVLANLSDMGPVTYENQGNDVRDIYRMGSTYTNTIAVDGGNESVVYRVSLSNMENKGIIPNSEFARRTVTARFGADVTEKLHIEAKANFVNSVGKNRPIVAVSSGRNIAGSINLIPQHVNYDWLKDYKNDDGSHRNWRNSPTNPFWILNEMSSYDNRDRLIGMVSANYKLTDWLSIQGRVGNDAYTESQREQYNEGTPGGAFINGRVVFAQYRVNELNADVLVTANGDLSSDLNGSISFGANRFTRRWESNRTTAFDMNIPGLYIVENANTVVPSYTITEKEIQSVFLTGQLAYKNLLFLDASARNDWSSTLGYGNYSFIYPSVSLSFALTDALALDSRALTFAKLRASFAQAGNDADAYQTTGGYSVETTTFRGQRYASINGTVPPTNLKNELTSSFEIGTDVRLFGNRVSVDFTYYDSKSTNQILPVDLSTATGYSALYLNAAEVSNKGIELFVSGSPIKIPQSIEWTIDVNFSKNKSEVIELVEGVEQLNLISTGNASIVARPGLPYGTIWGYKYKRSPDGQLVVHESGDYYIREDELSSLGDTQPDWLAGITNTISYKGFSIGALVDIRMGGEMYSWSRYDQNAKGTGVWTNDRDNLVVEGVIENEDGTYTPTSKTVWAQHYWAQRSWGNIGEEFVIDATYVALRQATFGYTFNKSLLARTPFNSAKLSVVGRNLLYLYRDAKFEEMGIAPETAFAPTAAAQGFEAFSMPTTRSIGFNLSVTF